MHSNSRLVILEEQPMFLDALASLLAEIAWVEVAKVAVGDREAFGATDVDGPDQVDVVTLDPCPRGQVDVEMINVVRKRWPGARLVAITRCPDAQAISECLALGIQSLLWKTEPPETIKTGIELVCRGAAAFSLPAASTLSAIPVKAKVSGSLPFPIIRGLSVREIETLQLVARGYTDSEIARFLAVSPRTINRYMTNILNKLNCRNRSQAVAEVFGKEPQLAQSSVARPFNAGS
jgi:DNA-binding NarL/FixJ family response regulator